MDKDTPDKTAGGIRQGAGPTAAEESLSDALNGLEQILEHRQAPPAGTRGPDGNQHAAAADPQYAMPVLGEVVVPGDDDPPGQTPERDPGEAFQSNIEDDEAYQKLSQRLANEIEVIVRARVEAAVHEAAEDIREQGRNHLEIMLPEIIEELNVLGRRQGG